jgi:uncharacterized protein (DUF427 family)
VAHLRDPNHIIEMRPSAREIRVFADGEMVAQTRRAVFLSETGHPTRYYMPPEDVRRELLIPSRKTSFCPYKGTASYWSLRVGDHVTENAVWAYLEPLPECARIRGLLCFYPEKISRLEIDDETSRAAS